jgi:integrase
VSGEASKRRGPSGSDGDPGASRSGAYTDDVGQRGARPPVLRDVATLILETGMRPEEVYTLRPENVDLFKGHLQVPHGKTAAARRLLRLTSAASDVLRRRVIGLEGPYCFPCESDSSRPIPKVNNAHDRAVKASKVAPFRLYDLRHTWATRAAMSGIDLVTLASMLGHSRIQMVASLRPSNARPPDKSDGAPRAVQRDATDWRIRAARGKNTMSIARQTLAQY